MFAYCDVSLIIYNRTKQLPCGYHCIALFSSLIKLKALYILELDLPINILSTDKPLFLPPRQ